MEECPAAGLACSELIGRDCRTPRSLLSEGTGHSVSFERKPSGAIQSDASFDTVVNFEASVATHTVQAKCGYGSGVLFGFGWWRMKDCLLVA